MKKLLTSVALFWVPFSCVHAQHHTEPADSLEKTGFQQERVDTIFNEKFEIAVGTDKSILLSSLTHFVSDYDVSGRFLSFVNIEKKNDRVEFFTDFTLDLTINEFPAHLAIGAGDDQIGHLSNVFFIGPGLTFYPSDIRSVHRLFYILRLGGSYIWFPNAGANVPVEGDHTYKLDPRMEYTVFAQLQPWHVTRNTAIFFETFQRYRKDANVIELETGFRNHKLAHGHIGLGVKAEFGDMRFERVAIIGRINLGQGNARLVKHKV